MPQTREPVVREQTVGGRARGTRRRHRQPVRQNDVESRFQRLPRRIPERDDRRHSLRIEIICELEQGTDLVRAVRRGQIAGSGLGHGDEFFERHDIPLTRSGSHPLMEPLEPDLLLREHRSAAIDRFAPGTPGSTGIRVRERRTDIVLRSPGGQHGVDAEKGRGC